MSVLTPVRAQAAQFLPSLHASVLAQELPGGWEVEWVVWEDGGNPRLERVVCDLRGGDRRVRYGNHQAQGGPGVARTQAFHASSGEVVLGVDADDFLEEGALAAVVQGFDDHPEAAWLTGFTYELQEDGTRITRRPKLGTGPVPAGATLLLWNSHGVSTPWYPTATAYRRDAVALLGGWPAHIAGEDNELLACASSAWDGVVLDCPLVTRRIWQGQMTRDPAVAALLERARETRHSRASLIDRYRREGRIGKLA